MEATDKCFSLVVNQLQTFAVYVNFQMLFSPICPNTDKND